MKQKFTLLGTALLFAITFIQASTYDITFSGSSATLERVRVENLTKGTSLEMEAGNTLRLTVLTSVDNVEDAKSCTLYPNPMHHTSTLAFENPVAGNVSVFIVDMQGRTVFTYNRMLDAGNQQFYLSGLSGGVYSLIVKTPSANYQTKLVSTGSRQSAFTFEQAGSSAAEQSFYAPVLRQSKAPQAESAVVTMDYTVGDELKFIGYANGFAHASIFTVPTANMQFTFNFVARYYRITGHHITSSFPNFVDVMFSVTDKDYKGVDNLSNVDFVLKEDNVSVSPAESFRYVRSMKTVPYKIKTVVLIDNSSSVENTLEQIKQAALTLVDNRIPDQEMAIYVFSDKAYLLQDFTDDNNLLRDAINGIQLGFPSTNLYGAFITGLNKWNDAFSTSGIQKGFLVLFTDGDDTQGSFTLEQAVATRGSKSTYIVGLGSDLTPSVLNQLANPSPYHKADKVSDLRPVFENIQKDIQKYANSFYWLNYMTPKRTGIHSLNIEVKDNTNSGADATHTGSFYANNFISVMRGAFINIAQGSAYGWTNLKIDKQTTTATITDDPTKASVQQAPQQFKDTIPLTAVTYWAKEPPAYKWTTTDDSVAKIIDVQGNTAKLIFLKAGKADITLTDTANNLPATNYFESTLKVQTSNLLPEVSTISAETYGSISAKASGKVISGKYRPLTRAGICWGTYNDPILGSDNSVNATLDTDGNFSAEIMNKFAPNQTVYIRAFAQNASGTSYGNTIRLPMPPVAAPLVRTDSVQQTQTASHLRLTVLSNNGSNLTEYGACWSTTPNPTINSNRQFGGNSTYIISQNIAAFSDWVNLPLNPATTYYIKSYARNQIGVAYGEEITHTTPAALPRFNDPVSIVSIASNSVKVSTSLSFDGGVTTERGFCWSDEVTPTIEHNSSAFGTGTGAYSGEITNLKPNTRYYIRAYATNSVGTVYSQTTSVTTQYAAPAFTYTSSVSLSKGTAITSLHPTHTGGELRANVTTLAGSNATGNTDGVGANARFNRPSGVITDAAGNIFVADMNNNRIRKITPDGTVSTVSSFSYNLPTGITIDNNGNLYISDNHQIRTVQSLLAGSATAGHADGKNQMARFNNPTGLAWNGNIFIADQLNHCIRKIDIMGNVTTFAGRAGAAGRSDGIGTNARFSKPTGITMDANGTLYIADQDNSRICKITSDGTVTTIVGNQGMGFEDGPGTSARFDRPTGIIVAPDGSLFIADNFNHRIRKISPEGIVSTVAGSVAGNADNNGLNARFYRPYGLTLDALGNIYVADQYNNRIKKLVHYTISPALPAGLIFNSLTGAISGLPTVTSPPAVYTISGGNESGNYSTTITIEVK